MDNRKIYLYLAILIPFVMIVIVVLSVFYYRNTNYPKYNFLYATFKRQNYYFCLQNFKTKLFPSNNQMVPKENNNKLIKCEAPHLYLYDFSTRKSTEMTTEEASKLNLSEPYQELPLDGFSVSYYCNLGSVLGWWWGNDDYRNNVCLKQKGFQEKLNIKIDDDSYFVFIGWSLGKKT